MRMRVFHLHNKKRKGYVTIIFFSEINIENNELLIILVKNSNLLKFIKAKCKLGALMVYMVTYQQNTFQLQILCLKFVKFYIF